MEASIGGTSQASQMDPELLNYYASAKQKAKQDHTSYLRAHPEIRQMLNDYLSNVLLHKPDNIYPFTRDYFAYFNKKKEGYQLPMIVVLGPSSLGGREDLCEWLLKTFPHLFERTPEYSTKPPTKEQAGLVKHVDNDAFEQMVKDNEMVFFEKTEQQWSGVNKKSVEAIRNKGKICLLICDLKFAEKIVTTGINCYMIYVLPANVEKSIREKMIMGGVEDADEIEKSVNKAMNELEELKSKTFVNRSFLNEDFTKLTGSVLEFLQEKYPKVIFKV